MGVSNLTEKFKAVFCLKEKYLNNIFSHIIQSLKNKGLSIVLFLLF